MILTPEVKKVPFSVSRREVDFFKTNYPIHYQVLLELVKRGEAVISDMTEVPG